MDLVEQQQNLLANFPSTKHDWQVEQLIEIFDKLHVLLPLKEETQTTAGDNIGFDYEYLQAVIGIVANRH